MGSVRLRDRSCDRSSAVALGFCRFAQGRQALTNASCSSERSRLWERVAVTTCGELSVLSLRRIGRSFAVDDILGPLLREHELVVGDSQSRSRALLAIPTHSNRRTGGGRSDSAKLVA